MRLVVGGPSEKLAVRRDGVKPRGICSMVIPIYCPPLTTPSRHVWRKPSSGGIILRDKTEGNVGEDEMKKLRMAVLGVMMVACLAVVGLAQDHSRGTSTLTLKGKTISVDY